VKTSTRLRLPATSRVLAVLRAAVLVLTSIIMTTSAFGWLYWSRIKTASWPGPRIVDALPLDELPHHADVSLVSFVAAFALSALITGLVARLLGFDRLTAGLVMGAVVGLWMLAVDTLSLYTVRQSTLSIAFHAALALGPIYWAAGIAGLVGAVCGQATLNAKLSRVLAWAVGVAGVLDILSAIIPRSGGLGHLGTWAPTFVSPVASALAVPAGVLLLLSARPLTRGSAWAFRLSVTVLTLSSALHLLKGLNFGPAVLSGAVAVGLVARRQAFRTPGDPAARWDGLNRLAVMIAIVFVYGVVAVYVNRIVADLPASLPSAVLETARAMIGIAPNDRSYLLGRFGEWFPWSIISLMAIGVGWAVSPWLAPWRERLAAGDRSRERALELVRAYGTDTLAPFAMRADKRRFFLAGPKPPAGRPAVDVLVPYRAVRGIALVSGDPIGPPEQVQAAVEAFLAYAHSRGWRVAILGASEAFLTLYQAAGLRELYHGDEAVIEVGSFSLEGGTMKAVRQAVNRVRRYGYTVEVLPAGAVDPAVRAQLRNVEHEWLADRPRKGFAMELDDLFRLDGNDALFVIGRTDKGTVAAFLHLAVCPGGTLSLSSMPRRSNLPNGVIAWLIVNTVEYARSNGYEYISLNFSPFAGLLRSEGGDSVNHRLQRDALQVLKRRLSLQLDNLLLFNSKFNPSWRARYVVVERLGDLPRVIVAAMAAEGYLPFSERIRGRDWHQRPEEDCSSTSGGAEALDHPHSRDKDAAYAP
jgi:lysyl-tRNA synthetase class 2